MPAGRPKAVVCAGGLRSSLVISALAREGVADFYNVIGGMSAWAAPATHAKTEAR